jgi:hypothetical protein
VGLGEGTLNPCPRKPRTPDSPIRASPHRKHGSRARSIALQGLVERRSPGLPGE